MVFIFLLLRGCIVQRLEYSPPARLINKIACEKAKDGGSIPSAPIKNINK